MVLPVETIRPSPVLKQRIAIAWRNIVQSQFDAIAKSMWAVVFSSSLLQCKEASDDGMSMLHSPGHLCHRWVFSLRIWQFEQFSIQYREIKVFLQIFGWFVSRHSWAKSETKLCSSVTHFLQRGMKKYVCLPPYFDVNASIVCYQLLPSYFWTMCKRYTFMSTIYQDMSKIYFYDNNMYQDIRRTKPTFYIHPDDEIPLN